MYPELALAKCQASSRRNSRKGKGDSVIRECNKIMHGQKDYPGTLLWVLNRMLTCSG